jgi:hypothetical protein
LLIPPGRQAPIHHQGRKDRRSRAHMDNSVRQGSHPKLRLGQREQYLIYGQALEGKDVKDLLLNVGSGGGAAPAAGGASAGAGGAAAAEETKEEEKVEGTLYQNLRLRREEILTKCYREGGVRRRHGFRSLRLSVSLCHFLSHFALSGFHKTGQRSVACISPIPRVGLGPPRCSVHPNGDTIQTGRHELCVW